MVRDRSDLTSTFQICTHGRRKFGSTAYVFVVTPYVIVSPASARLFGGTTSVCRVAVLTRSIDLTAASGVSVVSSSQTLCVPPGGVPHASAVLCTLPELMSACVNV